MRGLLAALLTLLSGVAEATSWQSATAEQLSQFVAAIAALPQQGQFQQQKQFPYLSQAIHSSGSYQRDSATIRWQTEQPLFNRLLISPTAVYQQLSDAAEPQLLSNNAELAQLLYGVLSGDLLAYPALSWRSDQADCLQAELTTTLLATVLQQLQICLPPDHTISLRLTDQQQAITLIQLTPTPDEPQP